MAENFQDSILHKISLKVGRNGKFEEFEKFGTEIKIFMFFVYPAFLFVFMKLVSNRKY